MSEVEDIQIDKMVSEYFKTNPTITKESLPDFLAKTELNQLFEDNPEYFWNVTLKFTDGKEEVDQESCKASLRYIFKINTYHDRSELASARNSEVFNISFNNNLIKALEENNLERRVSLDIVKELSTLPY